ncbi:MAG: DUF503 domain-containing protein [Planctomycetota bacterium]
MFIGVLQFELLVRGSTSLKDKRRVVKSVKDRLHRQHLVSIAEVAALEHHRLAVLGLTLTSGSAAYADQVLDRIVEKLRHVEGAELGELTRDVVPYAAMMSPTDEDGRPLWTDDDRRDAGLDEEMRRLASEADA